jgi:hypothetical protein
VNTSSINRRSFVQLVSTLAAASVVPVALGRAASASTGTVKNLSTFSGKKAGSLPLSAGFRPAVNTRLSVLEADSGLEAIPQGSMIYRNWINKRVARLESTRGVLHSRDDDDPDQPWRDATFGRVGTLDTTLPDALRVRFYTHMPLGTPLKEVDDVLRQRIADGSCNGVFLYGDAKTPLAPTPVLDVITSSGPPLPIIMSPKNVSDPAKLEAFMNYWAARPEWIPYVRVAYWQEFQGDFGNPGQKPISDWHKGVTTLADAADKVGIVSIAHAETWNLHPSKPFGGVPRLLQFLEPVIDRLGGGISWSVFVFNEKETAGNDFVRYMNEFMATYFPYTTYGVGAYGARREWPAPSPT